jgi:hypothetical protein
MKSLAHNVTLGTLTLATAVASLAIIEPAHASEATADSRLHGDLEVDPTAYALSGYSVHAGLGWNQVRLDLGAFAMSLPGFVHGNDGFAASFDGFGIKLQHFPLAKQAQTRLFIGVDAGLARILVQREDTDQASRRNQYTVGGHVGWRFDLVGGLYATPWLGLSYAFNASDVSLGGRTYENTPWIVFPAVHLGYRLR